MVDKAIFIGMNGAQSTLRQLEILTNNLANVNTTAFRGDFELMKSLPVNSDGPQVRVYGQMSNTYTDFKNGPTLNTGRDLDVAVAGEGFIAVQSKSGREAYTRAGNLRVTSDGTLVTSTGEMVLGSGGLINIPQYDKINIGQDGTISAILPGSPELVELDRIKLTNPSLTDLEKGEAGLFYIKGGAGNAQQDDDVVLQSGALEGSNVSPIETLTKLIDVSRHFEMHSNLMKNFADNASKANELLNLN